MKRISLLHGKPIAITVILALVFGLAACTPGTPTPAGTPGATATTTARPTVTSPTAKPATPAASPSPTRAATPGATATAPPPTTTVTAARAPVIKSVSVDLTLTATPTAAASPAATSGATATKTPGPAAITPTASPAATAGGTSSPRATATNAPAPAPTAGAAQSGAANGKMSVSVDQFSVVDKTGQAKAAGEGHYIYYIDVDVPITQGQPAVTGAGTFMATTSDAFTWTGLTGGKHTLAVQLVNNDNSPLAPPIYEMLVINVPTTASAAATPGKPYYISSITADFSAPKTGVLTTAVPSPSAPATTPVNPDNLTIAATPVAGAVDVKVSVDVQNFNIANKQGQAKVNGEGHYHYYYDVDMPSTPNTPAVTAAGTYATTTAGSFTFTNVPPGRHTLSVQLVNNDHSPLSPAMFSQAIIMIPSPVIPTPGATATPAVTKTPGATATPARTVTPTVTATVTPSASSK